jgi:hypothetical protein
MKFEIIREGKENRSLSLCMKQVSLRLHKYNKYYKRSNSIILNSKIVLQALGENNKKTKIKEKFNINLQTLSFASLFQ